MPQNSVNKTTMDLVKLNNSKGINISTNIISAFVLLFAIATFAQYYSTKLNLDNPLIPEYLVEMSTTPYLKKGIILIVGLLLIVILKSFKKNIIAFSLAILLVIYFIFSKHYFGGWNTQI